MLTQSSLTGIPLRPAFVVTNSQGGLTKSRTCVETARARPRAQTSPAALANLGRKEITEAGEVSLRLGASPPTSGARSQSKGHRPHREDLISSQRVATILRSIPGCRGTLRHPQGTADGTPARLDAYALRPVQASRPGPSPQVGLNSERSSQADSDTHLDTPPEGKLMGIRR